MRKRQRAFVLQAHAAMMRCGSQGDSASTRTFRSTFLLAFADRIGERLREASATAKREAEADHGDSLLPILAGREARVVEAYRAAFPSTKPMSWSYSNGEGWAAGRAAADRADLGTRRAVDRRG